MGLRSRVGDTLVRVGKTFGGSVPESFQRGEEASQMTPASPFSPGTPVGPYDGYDRTPRSRDFVTGYNIATRPRTHERVSFEALKGLIEAYDIAQLAIMHRIDSIRALDWKLVPASDTTGDVSDAIKTGMAALERPDREHYFDNWFAMWAWDVLAYDAGCLYRMRNRAGRAVGLRCVSGPTIAPLIDYWGNSPQPPAEAYVQYANGLPWNWLTRDDLIYEPFRPRPDSPYGHAPLESIMLNANTDIRFQLYFLERFTSGNLPAAFAAAPDSWSPDQIEQFQSYWDAMMFGDQAGKHQIKWMPPGSKFEWSNEKDFSDVFSLFLMRKSLAAYHVVPADMGFTENVNRSSGESQADVQHRLGDAPFARYTSRILTGFLQRDLGLPVRHMFDLGEEQDDRVAQAQADGLYMDKGVIGPSEIREMRYGRSEPEGRPVPRYIFSSRQGPIPLASLFAVAGAIDPETGAPQPGSALPHVAFGGVEGVLPNPPLRLPSLAEQEFGRSAIPPAPPPQPVEGAPVAKEAAPAPAAGITSETGIYSYDLDRGEDDEPDGAAVAKAQAAELAAFRRFRAARLKSGKWRDFGFEAADAVTAHRLNDAGRLSVRKAAGEVAVAGLAVLAADTGRVLMLQRAISDDDPASGDLEFPGGHIEGDESPLGAAWREWAEETGAVPPPGVQTGEWTSPDGVYRGIVWTTEAEASVPVRGESFAPNPDDPDGDAVEAILWVDPADLPGNPMLRPELAADLDVVMAALGCAPDDTPREDGTCCGRDCCAGACCGGAGGCGCGALVHDPFPVADEGAEVVKAGPKDRGPKGWPGWDHDLTAAAHWAAVLVAALTAVIGKAQAQAIARAWLQDHPDGLPDGMGKRDATDQASAWLEGWLDEQGTDLTATCQEHAAGIIADGWMIGGTSAQAVTDGQRADWGGWQPGDDSSARDRAEALGLGAGLGAALAASSQAAQEMARGYVTQMARALADGTLAGLGATALGGAVFAALDDREYSARSALAQLVIASGAAALAYYLMRKVEYGTWTGVLDERICERCLSNVGVRVRMGDAYPSGHAFPPIHPGDRCAVVPA